MLLHVDGLPPMYEHLCLNDIRSINEIINLCNRFAFKHHNLHFYCFLLYTIQYFLWFTFTAKSKYYRNNIIRNNKC